MISALLRWRDDRHRLAKLRFDCEDLEAKFYAKVELRKLKRNTEEWDNEYADFDHWRELLEADIDQIETTQSIRRARAWSVPIPSRPISDEPVYDDKYWTWCRPHRCYYLTDEGKSLLRREAFAEMEMRFKPWLSWGAFAISVVSLAVSLLRS